MTHHFCGKNEQVTLTTAPSNPLNFLKAFLVSCILAALLAARAVDAQASYTNLSEGRPLVSEDALSIDRYALEAYLAPVAIERTMGLSGWTATPGLAYGLVPRTQIEVSMPFGKRYRSGKDSTGLLGVDLSALYAFNRESSSLPALAVRASVLIPVGGIGPLSAHQSLKAVATRTFAWGRLHFNHEYTFGDEPSVQMADVIPPSRSATDISRWTTSVAMDKTLPLTGLLLAAEVFARRDIADHASPYWNAAAGVRYEVSPAVVLDFAVVTTLNAESRSSAVRFGLTRTFAVPTLNPGLGPWNR